MTLNIFISLLANNKKKPELSISTKKKNILSKKKTHSNSFFRTFFNSSVLNKTIRGIQVVCDAITESFLCASGPRTKYFEPFFALALQF